MNNECTSPVGIVYKFNRDTDLVILSGQTGIMETIIVATKGMY